MGKLTAWAEKILSAPECVKVLGKIQMCAKPIKPTCVEDVVVKKEEKKAAPAPAAKKAVEEKKIDNKYKKQEEDRRDKRLLARENAQRLADEAEVLPCL